MVISFVNLFKLLTHNIVIPLEMGKIVFFISLLQFLSYNLDDNYNDFKILKASFISYLIKMLYFTRIATSCQILNILNSIEIVLLVCAFSFVLISFILMIKLCVQFNKELYFLKKAQKELEWENLLAYQISGFQAWFLRKYNIFFPLILPILYEILAMPIIYLQNKHEKFHFWMLVFSLLGMIILGFQMFFYTYYFNQYIFSQTNSLARTINLVDIINPLSYIMPMINYQIFNIKYGAYINITIQLVFLLILISTFFKKHTYFDINIMHMYGTHLLFKIFFLFLLMFSFYLESLADYPIYFVISLAFLYKISGSLTNLHILSVVKEKIGEDLSSLKKIVNINNKKELDLSKINKKFMIILGYLYYNKSENIEDFKKKCL